MNEYISREEAIKELREVYENEYPTASGDFDEYASHDVPNILRNMKAADVQPVRYGRWIWDSNAPYREHGAYKCSNCGCHSDFKENYCYNCGARMDGDKANNVRNLTDEETEIYESWIDHEAKDTGVNIMDGDTE